jgi:hypothetical protein
MDLFAPGGESPSSLLQNIGIIGSLVLGAFSSFLATLSFRATLRASQADTLLKLTSAHREIWQTALTNPELHRVRSLAVDLEKEPPTESERRFVGFVLLHLNAAFHAARQRTFIPQEHLATDVAEFFSRPIPATVYRDQRRLLDAPFRDFVDDCLRRG